MEFLNQKPTERLLPVKDLYKYLQNLVQKKLWLKVLIGMVAGILLGAYFATQPSWIGEKTLQSVINWVAFPGNLFIRSEEHTSELQSRPHLVCRLLLEKKKIPSTLFDTYSYTESS